MSVRLGISVEGQTEERFVKDLLAPHLAMLQIFATPVIVTTSRSAGGRKAKGGGINVSRVTHELRRLLNGYSNGFVTSLYDFYGFEDRRPSETVGDLELRLAQALGSPKNFISYVQLHEFEGLLLANAEIVADYFGASELHTLVADAVARAGTPELVDDGPLTAPSKRLEAWTQRHAAMQRRYSKATKTLHGPELARRLSLPVIRAACPRFHCWLKRLENLAS